MSAPMSVTTAVIRHLINDTDAQVLNLDKLTYAGNLDSLHDLDSSDRYHFIQPKLSCGSYCLLGGNWPLIIAIIGTFYTCRKARV